MIHRHALAPLALLCAHVAACGAQPGGDAVDTATTPDELLVANAAVWSGHTIEVCWNIPSAQTDGTTSPVMPCAAKFFAQASSAAAQVSVAVMAPAPSACAATDR